MPGLGLPKERILRGHKAFSDAITRGNTLKAGSIRLFYMASRESTLTRVGFSTSRSIRRAVVRNRIKRCLREAVRKNKPLFPRDRLTLVFVYRGVTQSAYRVACKDVERDVIDALNRLREKIQT